MVDALAARGVAGAAFYHFDTLHAAAGSRGSDTRPLLDAIIERLAESSTLSVLEGEIPLTAAKAAFSRFSVDGHLVLVVASEQVRKERLEAIAARSAEESAAAEFERDADSLGITIIDTTRLTPEEAVDRLHGHVAALAAV